jgi:hypothetical protein
MGGVVFDVNTLVYAGAAVVIGFQLVAFAVFTKIYAIEARLLPDDPQLRRWISVFSLEVGILTGLMLAVGGLAASLYAVGFWGRASFGDLDPQVSLRVVVPAATAIVVGLQIAFSSFFVSVLGLKRAA